MEYQELMTKLQGKLEHGSDAQSMTREQLEQAKADSYNLSAGNLDELDGYSCPLCKNRGYIAEVVHNEMFDYYCETLVPCKCSKIRRAIARLNRSGLKNIVKEYTFEKYQAEDEWQTAIKDKATRFCSDDDHNWFFIGGQSGAGKTHICTAIAVKYIKKGFECKYMLWRDEIARLKAVINDSDQYGMMMHELKTMDVLYIDDLFKGGKGDDGNYKNPTPADINAAFEIINYRYNNPRLITIISSERTLTELNDIDEAIAGRIAERSKPDYCINLRKDKKRNWRMKNIDEI